MFMGNKNIPFKQNTQCEVREKKNTILDQNNLFQNKFPTILECATLIRLILPTTRSLAFAKKYDYFAVQSKTYFSCLFHCFYQTDTTFLCLFASLDFSLLTYISLSLTDDRSVSVHMKFLFVYLFIFIFSVCFTCKLSAVFSSLPLADSPPRDPQINAYK